MDYDPEEHGCKCSVCPLGKAGLKKTVVPPEIRHGAKALIVAEAPGGQEEVEKRPLIGPSGKMLARWLKDFDLTRYDVSLSNTLLCRPGSSNNLKTYILKLTKENKKRKKAGKDPWPSPIDCCRPRLLQELKDAPAVLALGATAFQAVSELTKKVADLRGFPFYYVCDGKTSRMETREEGEKGDCSRTDVDIAKKTKPFLVTYHPAYALRYRKWTDIIRRDVSKFFRHVDRKLTWKSPEIVIAKSLEDIQLAFNRLLKDRLPIAFDIETDGKTPDNPYIPEGVNPKKLLKKKIVEPLTARMRCFGVGNVNFVIVIPTLSIDGHTRFWSIEDGQKIVGLINELLCTAAELRLLTSQNGILYDEPALDKYGIWIPNGGNLDIRIAHHVGRWSELPHDLNFFISFYADASKHKFSSKPDGWESDYALHFYCGCDVATTAFVASHIVTELKACNQVEIYKHDEKKARFCKDLHKIGIGCDPDERNRLARMLRVDMEAADKKACLAIGKDPEKFNIASADQVREYLFVERGIDPPSIGEGSDAKEILTDSGDPSTSREAMNALLDRGVPPDVEEFIHAKLEFGEYSKLLGTFAVGAYIWSDKRVRSTWSPVTATGRLTCKAPASQTIPSVMKSMYEASEGHVLIASDRSNLEARLMAVISHDKDTIDLFLKGMDMHVFAATVLFGVSYDEVLEKEKAGGDPRRQFAKTFRFAVQYGAAYKKVWRMLKSYRDASKKRPYARTELKEIRTLYETWWRKHEAVRAYQRECVENWKKYGYLETEVLKRKRYFLDAVAVDAADDRAIDETKCEMFATRIQGTAADVVDISTFDVLREIPFEFAGPSTGLVLQCHDSLVLEVPDHPDEIRRCARILKESMTSSLYEMPLPCDLKVGKRMISAKLAEKQAAKCEGKGDTENAEAWKRIAAEGMRDFDFTKR